jgi:hypothetical protein
LLEAVSVTGVSQEVGGQNLQRHTPAQDRIEGSIHDAHATLTDSFFDAVVSKNRTFQL